MSDLHDDDLAELRKTSLNPLEVARKLKDCVARAGMTQRELANLTHKKRSTIANYLRLLSLPKTIQKSLETGKLSSGHAKALLSLTNAAQQELLHREIIRESLTVRQTEQRARTFCSSPMISDEALHLKHLESQIQQIIGTKVELKGSGARGQLTLYYQDLDELDRILGCLGIHHL